MGRMASRKLEHARGSRILGVCLGWQDGNACTTSVLREFFGRAYTGADWLLQG